MGKLRVGKSLKSSDVLWRYMPLDRFVDLVATQELHFSPLAEYAKSDPFEGYLPRVALDGLASVLHTHRQDTKDLLQSAKTKLPEKWRAEFEKRCEVINASVPSQVELYKNITSCVQVCCWRIGEHESEAMWKLYAKEGVAIKTTVEHVTYSLDLSGTAPDVFLGRIKYLDFSAPELKVSDCVSADGGLMGMIKRKAYEHEDEARLMITPKRTYHLGMQEPISFRLPVDVQRLCCEVMVSPFAGESVERSVRAVCGRGGMSGAIVSRSKLLDGCESLLDGFH